jgi:hypothetical protein
MALGSTQVLIEISARDHLGGKERTDHGPPRRITGIVFFFLNILSKKWNPKWELRIVVSSSVSSKDVHEETGNHVIKWQPQSHSIST